MRYLFVCIAFCFSICADDAATCEIKPAVVCDSINSELITTAEKYAEAVKVLADTVVTIPNLAIPGKLDVQEAQAIVKKIKTTAGECDKKKSDVNEIIADLKKLEKEIRSTDLVLQKIDPSKNAALTNARENAIKQSNSLLALLMRMNESAALKVKNLCKKESSDDEDSESSEEGNESDDESGEDSGSEDGDSDNEQDDAEENQEDDEQESESDAEEEA